MIGGLKRFARTSVARTEVAMWSIVFSPNVFITINTAAVMLIAAVTGFGRTYEASGGSESLAPPAE